MDLYLRKYYIPPKSPDLLTSTVSVEITVPQTNIYTPLSNILFWDPENNYYTSYTEKQTSLIHFYTGTQNPSNLDRLNLDAQLYVTKLNVIDKVGIGTTTPSYSLDVAGDARIGNKLYLYDANKYLYTQAGSNRIYVTAENTSGVAEFASYGIFLPQTTPPYNLYAGKGIELAYSEASNIDFKNGGSITTNNGTYVPISFSSANANVDFSGNVRANSINSDIIQSDAVSYIGGMAGSGFKLYKDSNSKYNIEIDNISVRNTLSAYEYKIKRITAINGTFFVTQTARAFTDFVYDSQNSKYYFEVENDWENVFASNDIIIAQQLSGLNIRSYTYTVYSISGTRVYITTTPTSLSVRGMEFVRLGNTSNASRQQSIRLSNIDNVIDFLTNVNSGVISNSNISTRLGDLNGLTFNNNSISGYGLYSTNAYLMGNIIATSGKIGGWNISGDLLKNSTSISQIQLGNGEIVLSNSSGVNRVKIFGNAIPGISYLVGGSNLSWSGPYTVTMHLIATNNQLQTTYYIQSASPSNDDYIQLYTTQQSASYNLNIVANKTYVCDYNLDLFAIYTLPSDDLDPEGGQTVQYSLDGTCNINGTLYVYDANNTLIYSNNFELLNWQPSGSGSSYYITLDIFKSVTVGTITTSGFYFKLTYTIQNYLRIREYRKFYEYINGGWIYKYYYITYSDLNTTYVIQANTVKIYSDEGIIAIGESGLLAVRDENKWIKLINDNSQGYVLMGNGAYYFGNTSSINAGAVTAWIENTNSTQPANVPSLVIKHGATSGTSNNILQFKDGAGDCGYIAINTSTRSAAFVSYSDIKLKENINIANINSIEIIKNLQLKQYDLKSGGKNILGLIAQEVEKYYPDAVVKSEPFWGLKKEELIWVLWDAIYKIIQKLNL